MGSYMCECNSGYTGNGSYCEGKLLKTCVITLPVYSHNNHGWAYNVKAWEFTNFNVITRVTIAWLNFTKFWNKYKITKYFLFLTLL